MYLHFVDINAFYLTRLGRVTRRLIGQRIRQIWPDIRHEIVLGLGYAVPFLSSFQSKADRVFAIIPPNQHIASWPDNGTTQLALADDGFLPFAENSIDRILIVHGLEFSERRRQMLKEVWRVMRPGGRLLILVPNRHGLWSRAENTPFGHGHPFSKSQLTRLLREHQFEPSSGGKMLFIPPIGLRVSLRTAAVWQYMGQHLGRPFGGIIYAEANKTILEATPITPQLRRRVVMPVPGSAPAGV